MSRNRIFWGRFALLFWGFLVFGIRPLFAQEAPETADVIDVENIRQLTPVLQIDFADLGDFDTGWFAVNKDASRFAVVNTAEEILVLDGQGALLEIYSALLDADGLPLQVIDVAFGPLGEFAVLYQGTGGIYVDLERPDQNGTASKRHFIATEDFPASIWIDGDVWVELIASGENKARFYRLVPTSAEFQQENDASQLDSSAVVRIGRIAPPFAVTSTIEGRVTLWDLTARTSVAEVDNDTDQPSVFGNINLLATHLAWRDNLNENLYLLDFGAQTNRPVAKLNGSYMQFMFLTAGADVILAANLDFEPNVYAWIVETGERIDLGAYRLCSRVPDMARLSADGTTLVIGCDTGLDIWRVTPR